MKNIETILKDNGIELTAEQATAINKAVSENYKTIAEVEKKEEKLKAAEEKLKISEDALKKFDGVNAEDLQKQIAALNEQLTKKDAEYTQKLTDRDFNDLLKDSIGKAKGKNTKAITALLDIDTLKASKNQKEDVEKALAELAKAEDSKMLFDSEEVGRMDAIGSVGKGTSGLSAFEKAFCEKTGITLD